jgi:hypothetical protein
LIYYLPGSGSTLLCNLLLASRANLVLSEPSWIPGLPGQADLLFGRITGGDGGGDAAAAAAAVAATRAAALAAFRAAYLESGVSGAAHTRFFAKVRANARDGFALSRWLRWFLAAFPRVPVVMTYRDPGEIIASHSRYCEEDILRMPDEQVAPLTRLLGKAQRLRQHGAAAEADAAVAEYDRRRRPIAVRCAKALAVEYGDVLRLLQAGQVASDAGEGGAAHRAARRWRNVHAITVPPGGGAGCDSCPAAHGSLLLLDYATMPERFFSGGRPGAASVAEFYGGAPLSAADAARARYISRYYSKSVFDKPHAFAQATGALRGGGTTAPAHAAAARLKRPVPEWVRAIVEQHFGGVLLKLRRFIG